MIAAVAKFVMLATFLVVAFCTLLMPPGPINSAAWSVVVPIDALVIAYYVREKYFAR